ncbi:MAG: hypothetical protein ACI9ES_001433 [Oceanospirillaceae bacterium]|jgi:hypothetical protein
MKITRGEPIAKLATWLDEIRSDSRGDRAKPWHYLSIEDDEFFKGFARSKDGIVLKALSNFETKLRDSNITGQEKWQALAFYVHFVGDIHQPIYNWVAGMIVAEIT